MIRTQVYLAESTYQNIGILAKRKKMVRARIIRELLEKSIRQEARKYSIGKGLLKLVNLKLKGPKDLSVKLDDYLYGNK